MAHFLTLVDQTRHYYCFSKNKGKKDGPIELPKKKKKTKKNKGTIDRIGTKSFTFSVKEFILLHNFIL